MESVLVTGANGLLGRYAAKSLLAAGFKVIGLDPWTEDIPLHKNCGWIERSLLEAGMSRHLAAIPLKAVIHAAAMLPASFTDASAAESAACNWQLDRTVADICRQRKLRLIYLSGTSLYKVNGRHAVDEDSPVEARGAYLEEKAAAEKLIREKLGDNAVILRVSAPYGCGQRASTVLNMFIDRALAGDDLYYYGKGTRGQDFTYAGDVGAALVAALSLPVSGIYNIASGRTISMKDLAHLVVGLIPDCPSQVKPAGRDDPQEDYHPFINIGKAERELHWKPATSLEQGIVILAGGKLSKEAQL